MRLTSIRFPLAACVFAVLLSACGGGDATAPGGGGKPGSSGFAVDGYLGGATVTCDSNGNGLKDAGEISTETDDAGFFIFSNSYVCTSGLIATGGISIDTRLPFTGTLKAPAGATVITPLTTLMASGMSESKLKEVLSISGSDSLLTTDPARTQPNSSTLLNADLMKKTLVLQQFAQKITEVVAGLAASGGTAARPAIYSEVMFALAQALGANPTLITGSTISETVMQALVKAAAQRVAASNTLAAGVKAGVAALNPDSLAQVMAGAIKFQGEKILGAASGALTDTVLAEQRSTAIQDFVVSKRGTLANQPDATTAALSAQLTALVNGTAPAPVANNLVANGSFSNGTEGWSGNALQVRTEGGNSFNFANVAVAGQAFEANLSYVLNIPRQGVRYKLRFKASSDRTRTMLAGIGLNQAPWTAATQVVNLTTAQQTFELTLTSTFASPTSRVIFDMGAAAGVVVIDDVELVLDNNLLANGNFSSGETGWSGNARQVRTEGGNSFNFAEVLTATPDQPFNANLSYVLNIPNAGARYTLRFKASSNGNRTLLAGIGLNQAPWTNVTKEVNLTTVQQTFELSFIANFANANSRVLFDMAGAAGVVVIDDVELVLETNLVANGDFSNGETGWSGNARQVRTEGGNSFNFANVLAAGNAFDANLSYVLGIPSEGLVYKLRFKASSDRDRTMLAGIGLNQAPWTSVTPAVNLTTAQQTFELRLTSTFASPTSRVIFDMGADTGVVVIDDVELELVLDSPAAPAPAGGPSAAAAVPTALSANVKSIFSDSYTNVAGVSWANLWSDPAVAITDGVISGNNYKIIDLPGGKEYAAIDFASAKFNATTYTHFNMDVWIDAPVPVGQVMNIKLSNHDGANETNAISYTHTSFTTGSWQRLAIPLTSFTEIANNANRTNIAQIVITAARANVGTTPVKIYFDNMYFSQPAP